MSCWVCIFFIWPHWWSSTSSDDCRKVWHHSEVVRGILGWTIRAFSGCLDGCRGRIYRRHLISINIYIFLVMNPMHQVSTCTWTCCTWTYRCRCRCSKLKNWTARCRCGFSKNQSKPALNQTVDSLLAIPATLLYLLTLSLFLARLLWVSTCSQVMHGQSLLSHHTHIYAKFQNNPGLRRGHTENGVGYTSPLLLHIVGGWSGLYGLVV